MPTDPLDIETDFPHTPPAELFRWWVEPARLARWWAPEGTVEARTGGAYRLAWPGMSRTLLGTITTWEPGQALAFTWCWSHEPDLPTRTVTLRFTPHAGGTRLHLTHGPYGDSAIEADDRQSHVDGWTYFLPKLQEQVLSSEF